MTTPYFLSDKVKNKNIEERKWGTAFMELNHFMISPTEQKYCQIRSIRAKNLKNSEKPCPFVVERSLRRTSNFKIVKEIKENPKNSLQIQKTIREKISTLVENVVQEAFTTKSTEEIPFMIALMFFKRDINDGAGQRLEAYYIFIELYLRFPKTMSKLLPLFPETHGSWLDLNKISCIIREDYKKSKLSTSESSGSLITLNNLISKTFASAIEKDNIGALKWAPRIGKAVDRISNLGKHIAERLYPASINSTDSKSERNRKRATSYKLYRKKLASNTLVTVENQMCENEWQEISERLETIPGKSVLKYRRAFLDQFHHSPKLGKRKHPDDKERTILAENFLQSASKTGRFAFKTKTLTPFEVFSNLNNSYYPGNQNQYEIINGIFASMVAELKNLGSFENTLIFAEVASSWQFNRLNQVRQRDNDPNKSEEGQGKVQGRGMEITLPVGILLAQAQSGKWANRLMLCYQNENRWISLPAGQKADILLRKIKNSEVCQMNSINLDQERREAYKVPSYINGVNQVLELAKKNNTAQEEMPKQMIFLTGGNEIDQEKSELLDTERMKAIFTSNGYQPPVFVFWNLETLNVGIKNVNDLGVIFLSGRSYALFKSILEASEIDLRSSALDNVIRMINRPKFQKVYDIIKSVKEGPMSDF